MKLSQIIINEDNEPDYTGIDDRIRQRLSNYKSHEQQWALTELRKGENIESIIDGLEYYRDKIKDNRYQQIMKPIVNPVNPKSLTQITLQQIKTGQQQYDAKYGGVSKRGAKRKAKETKHEYISTLTNEPDLKIIKIEKTDDTTGAAEAAREIAKETDWCVSHIGTGDRYLNQGPLYYIEYKGNRYLCHMESEQLMDVKDQQYEISVGLYRRLVKHIKGIGLFLKDKTLPEYRDAIKHSPKLAYYYAVDVIKGRWPEAEPVIMKSENYAISYARYVIGGDWPELEKLILNDLVNFYEDNTDSMVLEPTTLWFHLVKYSNAVRYGRWPEAEKILINGARWLAINYARDVIKARWPELESSLIEKVSKNTSARVRAFLAYDIKDYANQVVKGRWREIEPYIIKDSYYAYRYAIDVIEGRWPEAEQYIMPNKYEAISYANKIVGGRWKELEEYILTNRISSYICDYAKDVIRGRWPEAEQIIIDDKNDYSYWAIAYARYAIQGRWPRLEDKLLSNIRNYPEQLVQHALTIIQYIKLVVNGRWPEVEPYILPYDYLIEQYREAITENIEVGYSETVNEDIAKLKSAVGVVQNGNKWLLGLSLARDDRRNKWVFPGGGIEPGETPEIAAVREVYEETGVRCRAVKTIKNRNNKTVAFIHCRSNDSNRLKPNKEFSEIGWFTVAQMKSMKLHYNVRELIDSISTK